MGQAIVVHRHGGSEVLRLEEHDPGEPGPGSVRVRVSAIGVNFIDVYMRTGLYPRPTPFVVGLEGAGVVEATGPATEGLAEGAHQNRDLVAAEAVVGHDAAALRSEHAEAVRVVDHQPGTARPADARQFGQRREVAVHAEYPVRHHEALARRVLELPGATVGARALAVAAFARAGDTATAEDIVEAMKGGCNFPMGPLALLDLVGLDTSVAILDALYEEFRDPNFSAVPAMRRMVSAGRLGRKSGAGFYDYSR